MEVFYRTSSMVTARNHKSLRLRLRWILLAPRYALRSGLRQSRSALRRGFLRHG